VAGKRVLAFGITGIDKSGALRRLAEYCDKQGNPLRVIHFESEFLFSDGHGAGTIPRVSFLAASPQRQREEWERAWERLVAAISSATDDIVISMHGCYIRGHYGTRLILDPNKVAAIKPSLIITLIADVYDMWWRTESRAGGVDWKGRPSLEQLILGRRFEVAIGDQISLSATCRHLVVAVSHPCDTLSRCIFRRGVKVAYLSFPISEPRRMELEGDMSGIDDVSAFIRHAHKRQKQSDSIACICPLAIDELPLNGALERVSDGDVMSFDRDAKRWSLDDLWPASERLGEPPTPYGTFPVEQVRDAAGNIRSDVKWRDYRLAEQANCLAVFCPIMKKGSRKLARGVLREIAFATKSDIPVFVYQDPSRDEAGECAKHFNTGSGGTMEDDPGQQLIKMVDSLDDMFDAIEKV
jgi:hypothetical protein